VVPNHHRNPGGRHDPELSGDHLAANSIPSCSSVNDPNILQGSAADAARLTALAEFFAAKEAAGIQRGKIADAARNTAMAMFYASK